MFNDKDIKAYRDISAPDALRERVLTEARQTKKKPIILGAAVRNIAAIAACFVFAVLVMIPMLSGSGDGSVIYFNGEEIGANAISIAGEDGIMPFGARGMGLELSFKLDTKEECSITVSEGEVSDARVAEDTEIIWSIDLPDTEKTYFMTVENGEESFTLNLVHSENGWRLYRSENSN